MPARTATAIRFKDETHTRLVEAADERDVSINFIVNKACEYYLDRLIPANEINWTREAN